MSTIRPYRVHHAVSNARVLLQDGQALLCGPGMASLLLIRHGCVRALSDDARGASVLGRGHIIGARALVDGAPGAASEAGRHVCLQRRHAMCLHM